MTGEVVISWGRPVVTSLTLVVCGKMDVQKEVLWSTEMCIWHSPVDKMENYEVLLSLWPIIVIRIEMTASEIEICSIADVLNWPVRYSF
jgi:hypothetical protein